MAKATWSGAVLAESNWAVTLDGIVYFPPDALRMEYFSPSDLHTTGAWIGRASYYHITVEDRVNRDAAWYYPAPAEGAQHIKDHVAFWKGVQVTK